MRNTLVAAIVLPLMAACTTAPAVVPKSSNPPPVTTTAPPPPQQVVRPAPSTGSFRAPQVMNLPGLEWVIGRNDAALANLFGTPALTVKEGDARKLQFRGTACVLDVYLYPLSPGAQPSATYVEARRRSDGLDVDRAACAAALRR